MVILSFSVQIFIGLLLYLGVTIFTPQPQFAHFNISILMTVIAAFVENLSEPYYVEMLLNMKFQVRAKAESISIFIKSILIYFLVLNKMGLLAYAIAQLIYGGSLFIMYTL